MLFVSQICDIMVLSGFRAVIPGGQAIVPFVMLVVHKNLEDKLLPSEPTADQYAIARHIEKIWMKAAVGEEIQEPFVPGVKTGDIAVFVQHASQNNLWIKFREQAKKQ